MISPTPPLDEKAYKALIERGYQELRPKQLPAAVPEKAKAKPAPAGIDRVKG